MTDNVRRLAGKARRRARATLEWVGLPLLYGGLYVARLYRPTFHRTSPHVYRAADRLGVYPVIDHYHDPPVRVVPDPSHGSAAVSYQESTCASISNSTSSSSSGSPLS